MQTLRNLRYPTPFDSSMRVFYGFDSFLKFFKKNKKDIKNVKINPPKLGSNNFGSIEVTFKGK